MNHWLYLFYSPAGPDFFPVGVKEEQYVSRFTYDVSTKTLDLASETILLKIPVDRVRSGKSDGHTAGSLAFGPDGTLYISVGDDTTPHETSTSNYNPIDERPGNTIWDVQRSASNTNDLRGKILRIKPEDDGTYTIPTGNLFPGDATHRGEIYVMGDRNPYRIVVDQETGWLYWGEVGPDAGSDSATRGPRGYDEINQAREPGNYGWPYAVADNKPYHDFHWNTTGNLNQGTSGPLFDPSNLQNDSPNNTGELNLPDAQPALIWYPYSTSLADNPFPEMITGTSTRLAAVAGVYHFDPNLDSPIKLPEYFDDTLITYDWGREGFWEVKLDENGQVLKINRMFSNLAFQRPIDAEFGPDGALYVLEWGDDNPNNGTFGGDNNDAQLVRIEFIGNLPTLPGDYNRNGVVDAADFTTWRNSLGSSVAAKFVGADGNGDGKITDTDYGIWKSHFGESLSELGAGAGGQGAGSVVLGGKSVAVSTTSQDQAARPADLPVVDATDFTVWRNTLGSTVDLRADGSGPATGTPDGVVDQHDYDFWKANFGNVYGGGGGANADGPLPGSLPAGDGVRAVDAVDRNTPHRPPALLGVDTLANFAMFTFESLHTPDKPVVHLPARDSSNSIVSESLIHWLASWSIRAANGGNKSHATLHDEATAVGEFYSAFYSVFDLLVDVPLSTDGPAGRSASHAHPRQN